MRIWLALLLVVCMSPLLAQEWVGLRASGVVVYVHPGQEALAREVGDMAVVALPRLTQSLAMRNAAPFDVYAYRSGAEFERATGGGAGLRGISHRPGGTIRLRADEADAMRLTLAHELAHSLIGRRLGVRVGALPRWVDEGIAGHLSEPLTPDETQAVSRLVHRTGVLGLPELSLAFDDPGRREAAYLQSRAMVAWLTTRRPDAVPRLLDGLSSKKTFDAALSDAVGLTPYAWWAGWRGDVPRILPWLNLVTSPVTYAPLGLLVLIIAWRRLRRQRARLAEEDPDETEDGSELPASDEVGYSAERSGSQAPGQADSRPPSQARADVRQATDDDDA